MRLLGFAAVSIVLAAFAGCGGGGGASDQYKQVDPAVDLADAVRADISAMKTAEGGAGSQALSFVENMESRIAEAPAGSKAVYEQIHAKAKELNDLAASKASKQKLDAVVAEMEKLAAQLPGG